MNLQRLDPDWKAAELHGLANKAGIPIVNSNQFMSSTELNRGQICKCCYEYVNKSEVSLWENSKQLEFLGFGYPLFYEFLKNCIILLVLATCSYNALAIKQDMENNYQFCHAKASNQTSHRLLSLAASTSSKTTTITKICHTFMVQISKTQATVSSQQEALRIISFTLHLLALIYIRNRITKLEAYYDERTTSLSDYSIFIKGLPKISGIQKKLRSFLKQAFQQPHQIKQITLLPQYQQIQNLDVQRVKLIDNLRPYYDKPQNQSISQQMAVKLQQLDELQKQIHEAANSTKELALTDQLICQKIICVFNTEQQKQDILDQFLTIDLEKKNKYFGQNAKNVYMKEAPQPQQIVWKNANLPKRKRFLYALLGWGMSILLLVVIFIIFFLILEKKTLILQQSLAQFESHPDSSQAASKQTGAIALVYILILLIVIFDKLVISSLFYKFTDLQKHSTTSKHQFSFQLKLLLGLFFTTALMTLAVEAIRFQNYYTHPYGVIDEQTIMFFMNSIFVPFFWILNPTRIFKQIKRKLKYGKRSLTQKQANELMEDQKYEMGKRFAQILEMVWFTFLYSTLIPIGVIITLFGLVCYYWVDKYNLLRRSSVNGQISGNLISISITLLDFTIIIRPIGSIIFDSQIRDSYRASNVAMIIVGFVFLLLPKDKLIQFFNEQKFRLEQKTYVQAKSSFHKTYHTEHPVYRQIYEKKLSQTMIKKGLSFDSIDNSFIQMIDEKQKIRKQKTQQSVFNGISQIQLGITSAKIVTKE